MSKWDSTWISFLLINVCWTELNWEEKRFHFPFISENPNQKLFTKLNAIKEKQSRAVLEKAFCGQDVNNRSLMIFSLSKLVLLQLLIRHWKPDNLAFDARCSDWLTAEHSSYTADVLPRVSDQTNESAPCGPAGFNEAPGFSRFACRPWSCVVPLITMCLCGRVCHHVCLHIQVRVCACRASSCCEAALCFHAHNSNSCRRWNCFPCQIPSKFPKEGPVLKGDSTDFTHWHRCFRHG